jgi:hypothetical protein
MIFIFENGNAAKFARQRLESLKFKNTDKRFYEQIQWRSRRTRKFIRAAEQIVRLAL